MKRDDSGGVLDHVLRGAFVIGVALIAFLAGGVVTTAELLPGRVIADAYEGGRALYQQYTAYDDILGTDLWHEARTDARGVTVSEPERMQAGATLYTSGHDAVAYLVDAEGEVIHSWRRPYSTVWTEDSVIDDPQPDSHVYFRKAALLEDGGLLALYEGVGDSPYGYGLVRLDRDSEVVWRYLDRAHHSFDIGADGRVYALTHAFSDEALPRLGHLDPPRIDDYLVVLSPDGEELVKVDLLKAVDRSPWRHLLYAVSWFSLKDPLHTNDVDLIDAEAAARLPFAKEGQVLLTFRELGAIAVLDVEMREIVWAASGTWIGQHDADITDEGRILLFDNYGGFEHPRGRSRILEFDPYSMEIVWRYEGTPENPFESAIRSSQERLANGNTLITESNAGRILEVDREGETVWEFINPVRDDAAGDHLPIVCWAQRIDPETVEAALGAPVRTATTSQPEDSP